MEATLSTCYADFQGEETYWVWKGKLPLKDVVLGAGEGGIGKGFWEADMVARVTTGDTMPDDSVSDLGGPKNVILVTPEDHRRRAMWWRLMAAGADMSRVHDMTEVLGEEFTIPDHLPLLQKEIERIGDVGLVVLDPLSQLCDTGLTSVKFVRKKLWSPLRKLAEDTGCSILAMHHLTKAGSVAGSAALVQAARLRLHFALSEMDPDVRILSVAKTNISAKGAELTYTLTGEGHDISVEYIEPDIMPAERLNAGENKKRIMLAVTRATTPIGYRELAAEVGCTPGNARVILHRLAGEGLIRKEGRGKYLAA
jgi:hypothetical protein